MKAGPQRHVLVSLHRVHVAWVPLTQPHILWSRHALGTGCLCILVFPVHVLKVAILAASGSTPSAAMAAASSAALQTQTVGSVNHSNQHQPELSHAHVIGVLVLAGQRRLSASSVAKFFKTAYSRPREPGAGSAATYTGDEPFGRIVQTALRAFFCRQKQVCEVSLLLHHGLRSSLRPQPPVPVPWPLKSRSYQTCSVLRRGAKFKQQLGRFARCCKQARVHGSHRATGHNALPTMMLHRQRASREHPFKTLIVQHSQSLNRRWHGKLFAQDHTQHAILAPLDLQSAYVRMDLLSRYFAIY